MHVITQSAILFLWMQTLTFVKSQDCTLQQFLQSSRFDENFDTSNLDASYPPGKQVRVSCNVGYSGFFKLICTQGTWETRGTKCQPKSCGHPGDAQFADFALDKGDDFVFGSRVVYTCQKGYQMVSRSNFRTCMAGGWDGVVPVCEAQQCPVIHVDNNILVTGDPDEATYGNVLRFSCKSNSEILEGPVEIYCDENGEWSAEAPKCIEIKCDPPVIENGYVPDKKQKYSENEVLHFQCNPKFQRTEPRPSKCTKFGPRAEWSPTPLCEPIRCKLSQGNLEGTTYEPAYRNVFAPGDTLRVICGRKYYISEPQHSSIVTRCKEDGEWTIRPVCQEVRCRNQRPPHVNSWTLYWGQIITLDETVRYKCNSGYKSPDGSYVATCTRNGWSPDPLCQAITCDRENYPEANSDKPFQQTYRYRETVRYTCKEGFTGDFTRTCWERGWSGSEGCTAITCEREYYSEADSDKPFQQTYRYLERVRYTCKEGFTGDFIRTCEDRGWTGTKGCTEIICSTNRYPNADPQSYYKTQYKYNEEATYICKDGYDGDFTLRCGEDGWIGSNTCTATIKCDIKEYPNADIDGVQKAKYKGNDEVKYNCKDGGQFTLICGGNGWIGSNTCTECAKPSISKGFVVGPINQMVYFACDDDYKLFTKGWWGAAECNGREWSMIPTCIAKSECGRTPVIANGEVVEGTGRINCNKGYQPQVDSLTCLEGKWTSDGPPFKSICRPTANHCGPPPRVQNAVVKSAPMKEYLSDSIVNYQCRDNYEMQGEDTAQCKNGTWEMNIECTASCDRLRDERLLDTPSDKQRYINGDEVQYECPGGVGTKNGIAKCINGKWEKTVPCEVPPQDSDAGPVARKKRSQ